MPQVVVLERVQGTAVEELMADFDSVCATTLDEVADLDGVRALIVRNQTLVDADLLDRLPQLEIVGRAGAGLDNIDVEAAERAGVVVSYAPDENTASTAEHTLALGLCVARRIAELDRAARVGEWRRQPGRELAGDKWGVIGLGRIGGRVAELAGAIGMEPLAFDPLLEREEIARRGIRPCSLDDVLRLAGVVSLHVPLTGDTRHLIGARELRQMRADAVLVNTARGGLIDEEALLEALRDRKLGGAALDVREHEPPAESDPYRDLESVVLTPHVAGLTNEAQERVTRRIVADIRTVLGGGAPQSAIVDGRNH